MDASSSSPTPDRLRPLIVDAAVSLAMMSRRTLSVPVPREVVVSATNRLVSAGPGDAASELIAAGLGRSAAYRLTTRLSECVESLARLSITAASADADRLV